MKIGARPTDEQIIKALKRAGSFSPTYEVKNWLSMPEFGGFDDLNTSHVLYRLKKLEKKGVVWSVTPRFYGDKHTRWETDNA